MTSAGTGDAIAYHESLAAGWSGRYASGGFKRRADFFRDEVLPRLNVAGEWIDVGCGSGVFSRMLAQGGAEVLGLDGSPAMVEAARAASKAAKLRFEVGRVEDVGALARTFDGAICLSVLEYVPEPGAALAAIVSRLKPGGRLALSAPNRGSTVRAGQRLLRTLAGGRGFAYLDSSRHLWTRVALVAMAEAAGLEVDSVLGFDPLAPRPLWPLLSPSLWFLAAHRTGAALS